jgi:hypothetical protein
VADEKMTLSKLNDLVCFHPLRQSITERLLVRSVVRSEWHLLNLEKMLDAIHAEDPAGLKRQAELELIRGMQTRLERRSRSAYKRLEHIRTERRKQAQKTAKPPVATQPKSQ